MNHYLNENLLIYQGHVVICDIQAGTCFELAENFGKQMGELGGASNLGIQPHFPYIASCYRMITFEIKTMLLNGENPLKWQHFV